TRASTTCRRAGSAWRGRPAAATAAVSAAWRIGARNGFGSAPTVCGRTIDCRSRGEVMSRGFGDDWRDYAPKHTCEDGDAGRCPACAVERQTRSTAGVSGGGGAARVSRTVGEGVGEGGTAGRTGASGDLRGGKRAGPGPPGKKRPRVVA